MKTLNEDRASHQPSYAVLMKHSAPVVFFFLFSISLNGQNLVPNPSFEEVDQVVARWSGTFSAFHRMIQRWGSPTQGSPDLLFVKTRNKMFPPRPGFDLEPHLPRTGDFMVGIKAFGCQSGTLHCKEYLQIHLSDTLRRGEKYYFEYWVCPLANSPKVNGFGLGLSPVQVQEFMITGFLKIPPVYRNPEIIRGDSARWQCISGEFEAGGNYSWIIIGNFAPEDSIRYELPKNGIKYGFYLVDDVLLRPLHAKAPLELAPNRTIILENILFAFDKAEIQESSFPELDRLADYLLENASYTLRITGHTDDQGSDAYNLDLSRARAEAIRQYLIRRGIAENRLSARGMGSLQPLAPNDTEENRRLNRRVEVEIGE